MIIQKQDSSLHGVMLLVVALCTVVTILASQPLKWLFLLPASAHNKINNLRPGLVHYDN